MIEEETSPEGPGTFESVKLRQLPLKGKLTFFYEKNDGIVFAAEEQEAANGKYRQKFKLVGWSNGETYLKIIKEAGLKKNQIIRKEEAEKLLRSAFDAELKAAKKNLREAKENNTRIPVPQRVEWHFDRSVPMQDREAISRGRYLK